IVDTAEVSHIHSEAGEDQHERQDQDDREEQNVSACVGEPLELHRRPPPGNPAHRVKRIVSISCHGISTRPSGVVPRSNRVPGLTLSPSNVLPSVKVTVAAEQMCYGATYGGKLLFRTG